MAKNSKIGAHAYIWEAYFGHNSAIFWPNRLKFLWELRKLLSTDSWCEINVMVLNFRFRFLGLFAGKWVWVWGLKTRPKSWPTLGSFRVTCYLKIDPKLSDPGRSEVDFHFLLFFIEENASYQEFISEWKNFVPSQSYWIFKLRKYIQLHCAREL